MKTKVKSNKTIIIFLKKCWTNIYVSYGVLVSAPQLHLNMSFGPQRGRLRAERIQRPFATHCADTSKSPKRVKHSKHLFIYFNQYFLLSNHSFLFI